LQKLNATRDLWDYGGGGGGGGQGGGSRPPPGLPGKKTGLAPQQGGGGFRGGWGGGGGAPYMWLLLRNLTPQIDGSTLKTLCLQHGPLQKFHLFLNHGVALVRYSTREEAAKVNVNFII